MQSESKSIELKTFFFFFYLISGLLGDRRSHRWSHRTTIQTLTFIIGIRYRHPYRCGQPSMGRWGCRRKNRELRGAVLQVRLRSSPSPLGRQLLLVLARSSPLSLLPSHSPMYHTLTPLLLAKFCTPFMHYLLPLLLFSNA